MKNTTSKTVTIKNMAYNKICSGLKVYKKPLRLEISLRADEKTIGANKRISPPANDVFLSN